MEIKKRKNGISYIMWIIIIFSIIIIAYILYLFYSQDNIKFIDLFEKLLTPLITFISVIILYFTLKEQTDNNKTNREWQIIQSFQNKLDSLISQIVFQKENEKLSGFEALENIGYDKDDYSSTFMIKMAEITLILHHIVLANYYSTLEGELKKMIYGSLEIYINRLKDPIVRIISLCDDKQVLDEDLKDRIKSKKDLYNKILVDLIDVYKEFKV